MKYKVKWIEDHMSITRNMIRRYEKKYTRSDFKK